MTGDLKVYIISRMRAVKSTRDKAVQERQQRDGKGPGQGPWGNNGGGLGPEILPTINTAGPIGSVERPDTNRCVKTQDGNTHTHFNSDRLHHVSLILTSNTLKLVTQSVIWKFTLVMQLICGSPRGLSPITCK